MRKLQLLLGVCTILFCFTACSNEEIPQVSQKELNLNLIQSIAKEIGVNVKIELFNEHATRPLTNSEINKFKNEFSKIAELNGKKLKLTKLPDSRAIESFSYYGGVGYDGHTFDLAVHWRIDNSTGDIFDIYGGLGGGGWDDYYPYDYTYREMIHMGQTLHHANLEQISISLKADYVVSEYLPNSNGNHLMNRITSKVTATGIVYIQSYTSSFTIYSSGEGSWSRDWIDL